MVAYSDEEGDDAVFFACVQDAYGELELESPRTEVHASSEFAGIMSTGKQPRSVHFAADPEYDEFVLDSAATRHLTCDRRLLEEVRELAAPITLRIADGNTMELREVGLCRLRTSVREAGSAVPKQRSVALEGVAYDARIWCNLISVQRIAHAGYEVVFGESEAVVRHTRTGRVMMTVPKRGQLYVLRIRKSEERRLGGGPAARAPDAVFIAQQAPPALSPAQILAAAAAASSGVAPVPTVTVPLVAWSAPTATAALELARQAPVPATDSEAPFQLVTNKKRSKKIAPVSRLTAAERDQLAPRAAAGAPPS